MSDGNYRRPIAADDRKDVAMWAAEEDHLILQLVSQHGKKWSLIAASLPGRTDNGEAHKLQNCIACQAKRSHCNAPQFCGTNLAALNPPRQACATGGTGSSARRS